MLGVDSTRIYRFPILPRSGRAYRIDLRNFFAARQHTEVSSFGMDCAFDSYLLSRYDGFLTELARHIAFAESEVAAARFEAQQPHSTAEHLGILIWELDWTVELERLRELNGSQSF